MSFETPDLSIDPVFPDMDSLENSTTPSAQYQIPGVDLDSPAASTALILQRRLPTSKVMHLLSFATQPLADYINGLITQARLNFVNPPPTVQGLQDLQDQNAILTTQVADAATLQARTQAELDTAEARIRQLLANQAPDPDQQARIQELEAENAVLIEDNANHQQQLTLNQEELARLNAEITAHATTLTTLDNANRQLTSRLQSVTDQLAQAQQVVPSSSISNAPSADLTNPRDLSRESRLAAVAAYYAYFSSSPPGIQFIAHGASTLNQYMDFFVRFARNWLNPADSLGSDNVTRQFASHRRHTFPTLVLTNQTLPDETSMLAACFNLHERSDVQEIEAQQHVSCRFGHSCFIAQMTRDAQTQGTQHPSFSALMCLSNFVREDLRPRRYPLSYASFMRMIHSQTANKVISDIVERTTE